MNINKLNQGHNEGAGPTKAQQDRQAAEVEKKGVAQGGEQERASVDQVQLSDSGRSLAQIEADIRSMPEVNDATIERLRAALASGEYRVNYQRLAGKMLQLDHLFK